jgi:hypothetical protein
MPRRRRRKIECVWGFFCEGVEVFRLEANEATRQVITGRRNHVVGGHFSMKMRGHIVHEGGIEERFVRASDCVVHANRVWAQPETIRMNIFPEFEGEIYTPDYLVEHDAGLVRYEVKQWTELRPPKPADWDEDGKRKLEEAKLLRARLHRVREAYRRASLSFRVITERGIAKYWGDPDIIDEVIASDRWDIEPEELNHLITALTDAGGSLPMWRCEALFEEAPFPRGLVLSRIPERIVRIDLFSPIGPHTIVHVGVVSC